MKSISAIRKKNQSELEKELVEKREKLQAFRFGVSGAKVKNVKEARETRRDIARILTIMGETK